MPAPNATPQGILCPSSHSAFAPIGWCSPSPSPFYSFKGFWMEEEAFVQALSTTLGTLGDLYSVAASLGFPHSRVDQFMTSYPHNFPKVVLTILAAWYTASDASFHVKLDALEKAFKETHKGALFTCLCHRHSQAFKSITSIPRVQLPDEDAMDESLGEAVMNAIDIIPSNHLCLVRTLLRELLTNKDLLTVAAACGVNLMLFIAVTETPLRPLAKATHVFLPWFADEALPLKDKYLRLKFSFQCASLLRVFLNILEDYRPEIVDTTLLASDEHLFHILCAEHLCQH